MSYIEKQEIINIASIWVKPKISTFQNKRVEKANRENICDLLALGISTTNIVISKAIKVICIEIRMNEKFRIKYHDIKMLISMSFVVIAFIPPKEYLALTRDNLQNMKLWF